jgi:hypothetical protein
MKCVYTRLLSDEDLRPHLERGDSVAFKGLGGEWEDVERQVERLGFGDTYAVCRTKKPGPPSEESSVRVVPLRTQREG